MSIFGLGKSSRVQKVGPADAIRVQTALNGKPIPVVYGQMRIGNNLIDYTDFKAIQQKSSGTGGKGALGGKGAGGSYIYSAAVAMALCEGPVTAILSVYNNKAKQTLGALNMGAFLGTYTQSPWTYMTSLHPTHALNYRGIAYVVAGPLQLGNTPELSNFTFEVQSTFTNAVPGLPDASPAQVVIDLLTNANYGAGLPTANLGSLSVYANYCLANNLVVSMIVSDATGGATYLNNLAAATNSAFRWSSGVLDIIPYGDVTATGNGYTYIPPQNPQYDIFDDDFLPLSGSKNPIKVSRQQPADQFNIVTINFLNRANDYNPDTRVATNDAAIATFGPIREDVQDWKVFCDASATHQAAQLRLGRLEIRNTYQFCVGRRFIRLDPMDIVSLTHAPMSLNDQWVRITKITEQSDGSLLMDAEQYLFGTGNAPIYGQQINSGHLPNYNQDPGSVIAPLVFSAPIQLAPTDLELWCAVAGATPSTWGGANVWVAYSSTGTYRNVGAIVGPCRMGVLNGSFATGTDPDTTNTLHVDLTESQGALTAGTSAEADNNATLCYVDGEFISYSAATLTSAYNYDLGTRLRRGQYGSAIGAHSTGTPFARLDEQIFKLSFTKDQVGQTIYLKFQSFNPWGGGTQDLSICTVYSAVIGGPPTLYAPTSVTATAALQNIQLKWTNPPNVGVAAIEIWRSATSAFGAATHVSDAAGEASAFTDSGLAANTQYWYWIRARDRAGNTGPYAPSTAGAGATATTNLAQTADIASSAVTTGLLAANAATNAYNGTWNGYVSDNDNNWHTLGTLTQTFSGGTVQVDITIDWDSSASSNKFLKFQLLRDSSLVTNASWPRITGHGFQVGGNQADAKSFSIDDTPAAGSRQYDFQYQWIGPNNNQVTFDGAMRTTEIKR